MKAFGNILYVVVLFAIGYAIYPSLSNHLGWNGKNVSSTSHEAADPTDNEVSTSVAETTDSSINQPAPPVQESSTAETTLIEQRFPYPKVKSLEEITRNWTTVPENALPKKVTLKQDLKFQLGTAGSVTMPSESDVYAVGTNISKQVRVTMTPGSKYEALVQMADTDLKERVTEMYEIGVERIRARVDAQRESERSRVASAATITEAEKAEVRQPSTTASNDEVDIMKASVASGELEGLSPSDITAYRMLGFEKAGQTVFQVGAAVYAVKTMFGTFQTEAKAFIRDGRVIRWERVDE